MRAGGDHNNDNSHAQIVYDNLCDAIQRAWRTVINKTGRVTQWFGPNDLEGLVKLTRVLAAELAIDGCMDSSLRYRLSHLTTVLDEAIDELKHANTDGACR